VFARKWTHRRLITVGAGSLAAAALLVALAFRVHSRVELTQVPFSDLLRGLDNGVVTDVLVNGDTLDFKVRDGRTFRTVAPANYVTANASFVPELARKNVRLCLASDSWRCWGSRSTG